MSVKKSVNVVEVLKGMSEEELKGVLGDKEVLERLRSLRKSGGSVDGGLRGSGERKEVCVRCNRGIEKGKKYVVVDGMVMGVECGEKYKKEKGEGVYDGLSEEEVRVKVLERYKEMMREKMKRLW